MSRTERYKKRCAADGDGGEYVDVDNPLPGYIDPITLEPVVTPAMSPHGHVMGLATWKVQLSHVCMASKIKSCLLAIWQAYNEGITLRSGALERIDDDPMD